MNKKQKEALRKKVALKVCEETNCDLAVKMNCRVNFNVICEGCYKIADAVIPIVESGGKP